LRDAQSAHLAENRGMRGKGVSAVAPGADDATKLLYLAILNAVPAWTRTRNWTTALLAFKIHFGDRLPN
jgi:transposase-like protein